MSKVTKNYDVICCPDCRYKTNELRHLNQHIKKTGHRDGMQIKPISFLKILGLLPLRIFGIKIDESNFQQLEQSAKIDIDTSFLTS